jgi:hypothetical protein
MLKHSAKPKIGEGKEHRWPRPVDIMPKRFLPTEIGKECFLASAWSPRMNGDLFAGRHSDRVSSGDAPM